MRHGETIASIAPNAATDKHGQPTCPAQQTKVASSEGALEGNGKSLKRLVKLSDGFLMFLVLASCTLKCQAEGRSRRLPS